MNIGEIVWETEILPERPLEVPVPEREEDRPVEPERSERPERPQRSGTRG